MSKKNIVQEPTATYNLTPKKLIYNINELDFTKQYTYADYLTWCFKERVELIKGWIHKMSPAPSSYHQLISSNCEFLFEKHLRKKSNNCKLYHAPFDVRLFKNIGKSNEIVTVVQPDICIICDNNKIDKNGCLGSPDMIVEILSPSTAKKDYNEKFFLYQENLVKEYWIVNPDAKSIEVFTLDKKNKYQSVGIYNEYDGFTEVPVNLFPKLKLSLKEIFEE